MRRHLTLFLLIFLAFASRPAAADLELAFDDSSLFIKGMTPGGDLALLSVAREPREWVMSVVMREDLLSDDDSDGAVRYEIEKEVPVQSIWAVVDVATGEVAAGSPDGFVPETLELPPGRLLLGPGNASSRLASGHGRIHALWVRPGEGAWTITAGDGGPMDADGKSDHQVLVALDQSLGLATEEAAPVGVFPRDVLIVIDPDDMSLGVRLPVGGGNSNTEGE